MSKIFDNLITTYVFFGTSELSILHFVFCYENLTKISQHESKSGFFLSRSHIGWDSGFSSKIRIILMKLGWLDSLDRLTARQGDAFCVYMYLIELNRTYVYQIFCLILCSRLFLAYLSLSVTQWDTLPAHSTLVVSFCLCGLLTGGFYQSGFSSIALFMCCFWHYMFLFFCCSTAIDGQSEFT